MLFFVVGGGGACACYSAVVAAGLFGDLELVVWHVVVFTMHVAQGDC